MRESRIKRILRESIIKIINEDIKDSDIREFDSQLLFDWDNDMKEISNEIDDIISLIPSDNMFYDNKREANAFEEFTNLIYHLKSEVDSLDMSIEKSIEDTEGRLFKYDLVSETKVDSNGQLSMADDLFGENERFNHLGDFLDEIYDSLHLVLDEITNFEGFRKGYFQSHKSILFELVSQIDNAYYKMVRVCNDNKSDF